MLAETLYTPLSIDTDDLPARDLMPLLRDYYAQRFFGMDIAPRSEMSFRLRARTLSLPEVQFGLATATTLSAIRHKHMLADGMADIGFAVFAEKTRFTVEGRHDVTVEAGDGLFYPLSRWWRLEQGPSQVHGMRFSRALLGPLVPDFDAQPYHLVRGAAARLGLLTGYTDLLIREGTVLDANQAAMTARHLAEIAAHLLGAAVPGEGKRKPGDFDGVAASRFAQMKRDVARLAGKAGFDVTALARLHGVTPRYVQMLFDRHGTTFTAYLRDCRLEAAHRLLTGPGGAGRSIGDIAYLAGFSDLSHFNRAFRARFAASPREIRGR